MWCDAHGDVIKTEKASYIRYKTGQETQSAYLVVAMDQDQTLALVVLGLKSLLKGLRRCGAAFLPCGLALTASCQNSALDGA